jgi:hypothetical protein
MGEHDVTDGKPAQLSPIRGHDYWTAELKSAPNWNFVAYLKLKKAHLRYYVTATKTEFGTVGFATNNPGSLDYVPWGKGDAITVAGKNGAYNKDQVLYNRVYGRFAVFPDVKTGMNAVIPALKAFAGKDGTVRSGLLNFKGCEKNQDDAKMLGLYDPNRSFDETCKLVKNNYETDLTAFIRDELKKEGTDEGDLDDDTKEILDSKMSSIKEGTKEARVITNALMRKEGIKNKPGVVYDGAKLTADKTNRSKTELDLLDALLKVEDAVKKEIDNILKEGP